MHERALARSPLCATATAQEPRLHRGCGDHAGAGDWCQHRGVQCGRSSVAASASLSRFESHCKSFADVRGHIYGRCLACQLPGLGLAKPGVCRDGSVSWMARKFIDGRSSGAGQRHDGHAQFLSFVRSKSDPRPRVGGERRAARQRSRGGARLRAVAALLCSGSHDGWPEHSA